VAELNLRSKLPDVGTTIFTVMSGLAEQHGAINLSQGFPDFSAPPELMKLVSQHMRAGHNQYAPMPGIPALREAIADKTERCCGFRPDADKEITVTSGATSALFAAIESCVHPGDEVIVFDPAYDSYDPAIRLAGGTVVHLPLQYPGFGVDWNRVSDAVNDRTAMIILNSPHNPTGAVLHADDLTALSNIVCNSRILLLSDEVYEHMVFDGAEHASLLHRPELRERALVVSSFGKTFHTTGWKTGYCIAPATLTAEFRRVHQFTQFCVVTPMQWALADFLKEHPEHYEQLPDFYQAKRDHFVELMSQSKFRLVPSAGTYFQLADYSALSSEPDTKFTTRLTVEHGVAAIPVSVFYKAPPAHKLVRFCFAKTDSTLNQAAEILCKI